MPAPGYEEADWKFRQTGEKIICNLVIMNHRHCGGLYSVDGQPTKAGARSGYKKYGSGHKKSLEYKAKAPPRGRFFIEITEEEAQMEVWRLGGKSTTLMKIDYRAWLTAKTESADIWESGTSSPVKFVFEINQEPDTEKVKYDERLYGACFQKVFQGVQIYGGLLTRNVRTCYDLPDIPCRG